MTIIKTITNLFNKITTILTNLVTILNFNYLAQMWNYIIIRNLYNPILCIGGVLPLDCFFLLSLHQITILDLDKELEVLANRYSVFNTQQSIQLQIKELKLLSSQEDLIHYKKNAILNYILYLKINQNIDIRNPFQR